MAIASELNVYRDTYRLTQFLLVITKQFDKMYKYTLGQRMVDSALGCLKYIQLVNVSTDAQTRLEYFDLLLAEFENVKVLIRLSADPQIKCISEKKYAYIIGLLANIGKQITAWRKSQKARV